jgi:hypothetical protein
VSIGFVASRDFRHAPGGLPTNFLNARLKAASDSYPGSAPTCATLNTADLNSRFELLRALDSRPPEMGRPFTTSREA